MFRIMDKIEDALEWVLDHLLIVIAGLAVLACVSFYFSSSAAESMLIGLVIGLLAAFLRAH